MDVDRFFPEGLRVLAVDDDRACLLLLKTQLKFLNYNNVTTVTDATIALDMLRERKGREDQFDLVISDIFMVDGIDGFKLLEHISLEMDIPVILISANDEKELMMKGVKHGACDYLVKPARLEQLRTIWLHVVRKSVNDQNIKTSGANGANDATGQKLQSGDGENGEKDGANHTRKHSKKNKGSGAEEDMDGVSTQKKQRIQWNGELHRKFLEAIDQIGMDKAVPKKILEVMNMDGLTRECIASHLQKYRIYLKKLNDGTFSWHSNPMVDELQARLSGGIRATGDISVPTESSQQQKEPGIPKPSTPLFGSSSSSNPFIARMSTPFAFGTHSVQPNQSVQHSSTQRNLGIPQQQDSASLPKDIVSMPVPVQDVSKFISGASQCFPSRSSSNSSTNMFNTGSCVAAPSSSCASISNNGLGTSMHFPLSRSCTSYASILRSKMLEANRGIPFDAESFFEEIANGEMSAPSSHLPLQPPELVNQPSVQIQSSFAGQLNQVAPSSNLPVQSPELVNQPSAGLFNPVAREPHQLVGLSNSNSSLINNVPSRFPDIGHISGTFTGPTHGNNITINKISRFVASSSQVPTFGNQYQNQMAGLTGADTPMVGFSEQVTAVTPFNSGSIGSSTTMPIGNSILSNFSSIKPTLSNLKIGNHGMLTQIPNGGVSNGNLRQGGTTDQQSVGDQENNSNELPAGTSKTHNGATDDMDVFLLTGFFLKRSRRFADLVNQPDFVNNCDAFFYGTWSYSCDVKFFVR